MRVLAEEWKRRDKEREILVKKRVSVMAIHLFVVINYMPYP